MENDDSLVDAVARCGDPVLVEYRSAASVSAREAEEGRAAHRHLPGPAAERRVLAADDSRFRPREQRRHAALHVPARVGRRDRHHRTRPFLARRLEGARRRVRFSRDDARRARRRRAARGRRHRRHCRGRPAGRDAGERGRRQCGRCRT